MENKNLENFDILDNIDLIGNIKNETFDLNIDNNETLVKVENEISQIDLNINETKQEIIQENEVKNEVIKEIEINNNIQNNSKIFFSKTYKKYSLVSGIIFLIKYILTSSMIFAVLLVSTNYNAYISVAKSYIYKGELETKEQKLISSVEASSIKEKYAEEKIKQVENEENSETSNLSIKKIKKEQDKENINLGIEITPYENRIIIPKIGKNIPLLDIKNRNIDGQKELNNIFMKELENGVIRYPGSAKPGEEGASFIFGHSSNFPWTKGNYNEVFALLDNVVKDDEIIVYYGQEKYVYKIKEKKVVKPGDVSVLERNQKKSEISIMTCWPIGTTINRLIVTGELVK